MRKSQQRMRTLPQRAAGSFSLRKDLGKLSFLKVSRLFALVLMLSLVLASFGAPVPAKAEDIDPAREGTLTLVYRDEGRDLALSNASFSLYRFARVDAATQKYVLSDEFSDILIDFDMENPSKWPAMTMTLAGFAALRTPTATVVTEKYGRAVIEDLIPGLYLVVPNGPVTVKGYVYHAATYFVALPEKLSSGVINYDVESHVKVEKFHEEGVDPGTISRSVLKIFSNDTDHLVYRPEEVKVQLLRDGKFYDRVTLTAANNWTHTWNNLSDGYDWLVVEEEIAPGYEVKVEQKGITFTITNRFSPAIGDPPVKGRKTIRGDQPVTDALFRFALVAKSNTAGMEVANMPMPPGSSAGRKTVEIRGEEEFEFGELLFTRPGVYVYDIVEENTNEKGYTYDLNVYTITYRITLVDGKLEMVRDEVTNPEYDRLLEQAVFINTYKSQGDDPSESSSDSTGGGGGSSSDSSPGESSSGGGGDLPYTGQLFWPIPVLLILGVLFIVVGLVRRKPIEP